MAPTLVVAGDKDPFYTEALFRETAEGIPHARLILYKGMGHPAAGKQFEQDVLNSLKKACKKLLARCGPHKTMSVRAHIPGLEQPGPGCAPLRNINKE